MIQRLQTGAITSLPMDIKEGAKFIDRPAMLVYEGEFESMDGPVKVTAEHLKNLADAHNSHLSKFKRLANGELPPKNCPPIQLDHTSSARDTVGRLVSDLQVGLFTNDEGQEVSALFGTLRFLGVDNCERVMDGRWTDLSIGADFENSVLSEITVTPFPAAKGSALLSSKRKGAPQVKQLGAKKIEDVDVTFWEITDGKGVKSWESSWRDSRGRVLQDKEKESLVSLERLMAKAIRKDKKLSATRIEAFQFPGREAEIHQKDDGKFFGRMYIGSSIDETEDRNTIEEVKIDLKDALDKLDNALESPIAESVDKSSVGPDGLRLASDNNEGGLVNKFSKRRIAELSAKKENAEEKKDTKLADGEAMNRAEWKAYLVDVKGMTEEEAETYIEEHKDDESAYKEFSESDEGKTRLSKKDDDEDKDDKKEEKTSKLSKQKLPNGDTLEVFENAEGKWQYSINGLKVNYKYPSEKAAKEAGIEDAKHGGEWMSAEDKEKTKLAAKEDKKDEDKEELSAKEDDADDDEEEDKKTKKLASKKDKHKGFEIEVESNSSNTSWRFVIWNETGVKRRDDGFDNAKEAIDEAKNYIDARLSSGQRTAKLTAAKKELTQLSSAFKTHVETAKLAASKGQILTRLSRLRSQAKITPAEVKKLDLVQLSKAGKEAIDLVMKSYEDREPVIVTGQLGSIKAESFARLGKTQQLSRLEAETRANMSLKRGKTNGTTKLSEGDVIVGTEGVDVSSIGDHTIDTDSVKRCYEELLQLLDQGNVEAVRGKLQGLVASALAMGGSSEYTESNTLETETQLSALVESVTKMQTQYDDLHKLAGSLVE